MVLQVVVHFIIWLKLGLSILTVFGVILVSVLLAGTADVNAVVRQYCCNTETEDRVRVYQFMRDLIACRDWYNRNSRCIYQETIYVMLIIFSS